MSVGEIVGVTYRVIGHFIVDITAEILDKGVGYLICHPFSKSVEPDSLLELVVGLVFRAVFITVVMFGYSYLSEYMAVDSCLDSGGRFNYEAEACVDTK